MAQKRDRERLQMALKASNEGVYDWNLETGEIYYSNRLLGAFGYGQVDPPNLFEDPELHFHPDYLPAFRGQFEAISKGERRFLALEPRMRTAKGTWKWFRVRGTPVRDESGTVKRLVGSIIDISKRKGAEAALAEEQERLQLLFENIPVNIYFKDTESKFRRANQATAERMGLESVAELVGKTDADFFDADHAEKARQDELKIMETGVGFQEQMEEETWEDQSTSYVLVTKQPWRGPGGEIRGTFGMTNDVTELVAAQKKLSEVTRDLAHVNQGIEAERHLLRLVIDNIPLYVYFKDAQSRFVLVNSFLANLFGVADPKEVIGRHDQDFFGKGHGEKAAEMESQIMEQEEPVLSELEKIEWDSGRVSWTLSSKFPWYDKDGSVKGTFGVSSEVTELVESREQVERLAESLESKNKEIQGELRMAREVQQAGIPESLPQFRGGGKVLSFYHRYEPASGLSGDFFEVIPLGRDRAGFFICDVLGSGVRAALLVNLLRGLVERGIRVATDPGEFLARLNNGLVQLLGKISTKITATAIYGVADPHLGKVSLSVAGHLPPLVRNCSGEIRVLEMERGPELGHGEKERYEEVTLLMEDMDALYLYTDGLVREEDAEGEEFGSERVAELLAGRETVEKGIEAVRREGRRFSSAGRFLDDVCILGLEIGTGDE